VAPIPSHPLSGLVDQWFEMLETLISAQRSWMQAALQSPTVATPMSQRLVGQTANEQASTPA
jgi:hypothetical protein